MCLTVPARTHGNARGDREKVKIYVSDIIQKTRIRLNEEGVEAAAVTAIMERTAGDVIPEEPKEFTADEPFSFFIYTTCNDTTAILFAGEIME